ncbi:MAG: ABC transporter substrate-binding protein, partial [Bacteroidia bacterium]|nr:ABC transporter substrate-binding protein [Bacteroidia bacterium]
MWIRFFSIVLLVVLSACQERGADSNKTVFRYNQAEGISSLDPAFARSQANIWACNQLFNGLVQLDDDLGIQACIAKSWKISEDGLTYTFLLRKDVYFHRSAVFGKDSTRVVNAQDFVYSLGRIGNKEIASPGLWVLNAVKKNERNEIEAFVALNDTVIQIKLEKAFPPFLGLLATSYCSVVPKEQVDQYGKDFRVNPIGTGPFMFKYWDERNQLIYQKNPNYFEYENGERLPYLDAVSISFIADKQAAFLEFLKGELDFVSGLDASYKDDLLTRSGELKEKYRGKFRMETCSYLNTEYLGMMMDPELSVMADHPLNNKLVRQAINYGFDKKRMISYLRNGVGTAGEYGILPAGLPGFDTSIESGYSYKPEHAKKLLIDAGYPGGKGLGEIILSTTPQYQDLCEYMQGQLSEIGINIKLEVNQGAALRTLVAKQQAAMFRSSWIADYPDAENYLSLFYSKNKAPVGPNYTHYSNNEYDQ